MGRLRTAVAATVLGAAIAAQGAVAQTPPDPPPPEIIGPPGSPVTETPVPALPAPPAPKPKRKPKPKAKPKPAKKPSKGSKDKPASDKGEKNEEGVEKPKNGGTQAVPPPILPSACGPIAVPVTLIRIYQAASTEYALGPAGPSILAAINEIETGFGQNLG